MPGSGFHRNILSGAYLLANCNIACSGCHGHSLLRSHLLANRHIACAGRHGHAAVICRDLLAYVDITGIGLHDYIFLNLYIIVQQDIPFAFRFCIQCILRRHSVRHMQIAVLRNQVCISSGVHFSAMVDDDVLTSFACHILFIGSLQRNIPLFCRCLAIHCNLSVSGFQRHVLFCGHRVNIRFVVADMDIAVCNFHVHVRFFRFHRGLNIHIAFAGIDVHILVCFNDAYFLPAAVLFAYGNIAGAGRQCHASLFRRNILAYRNIALIRPQRHIVFNVNVLPKGQTAFSLGFRIQGAFRLHIICYHQIAVYRNQVCISSRIHYPGLVNDNILAVCARLIFFIRSLQRDIPFFGRSLAINDNLSIVGFQGYVSFGRHGLCISIVASNMDIAVYGLHAYICIL